VAIADDGTWGFGLAVHGDPVVHVINDHLAPALVGEPCMASEKHWDLMGRATAAYSSSGLASYAISAVDVALWDLKGKLLGHPVYELLGGPQKQSIFCYASNTILDYGMEASLEWFLELGFRAVKIFLVEGPEAGLEGLRRSEERVARAREIVGDDVELAIDAWMSLDIEYTVRLAEVLRPYRIKWLEDYLDPQDLRGYARIRRRVPDLTFASGEHWYAMAPFAAAASEGLVDILQPDVLWCGGITNAVRICHVADAGGLSVIAHAGMNTPFGQHLSFAMPAIAWGERSEGVSPPGVPLEEMVILPGTPVIKNGTLVPSDAPGFGLEITLDWLEAITVG
jgi:L-rhamnonate dehydratase